MHGDEPPKKVKSILLLYNQLTFDQTKENHRPRSGYTFFGGAEIWSVKPRARPRGAEDQAEWWGSATCYSLVLRKAPTIKGFLGKFAAAKAITFSHNADYAVPIGYFQTSFITGLFPRRTAPPPIERPLTDGQRRPQRQQILERFLRVLLRALVYRFSRRRVRCIGASGLWSIVQIVIVGILVASTAGGWCIMLIRLRAVIVARLRVWVVRVP